MPMRPITEVPPKESLAEFRPGFGPRFILTVDTEEEFDWDKPIRREGYGLEHLPRIAKFQTFCEKAGVSPIYLVDYPIATSALAADILQEPLSRGTAEVGLQLHPWVNPPHEEDVSEHNSFVGNLPCELEKAKFVRLRNVIESNFNAIPAIYRAGRYGLGLNSAAMLRDGAIAIDSSVRSKFNYAANGGRDYRLHPVHPYWLDDEHRLLELPLTTVFAGKLRRYGDAIHPKLWRIPALRGVLSKLGLLERIPLTPEGVSVEEAIRGIDVALESDLPLLVFSFHSPSLHPGHTPYVRTDEDVTGLYRWWESIFAHLQARGVKAASVRDIMNSVVV